MNETLTDTPEEATVIPLPSKAASLSAWKQNKLHYVTLPSSTVVGIVIPDLPALVKSGAFPNELVEVAISVANGRKITPEDITSQGDFYNKLVALSVKEPAVSEADCADLPFEDRELIVQIATRQRDLDAVGHHIGGLEKVEDFRTFRGLASSF